MMSDLMKNITGGRKKKGTKKRGGAGEIPGLKPVQTGGQEPQEPVVKDVPPMSPDDKVLGEKIIEYNKVQANYNANPTETPMSELTRAYNELNDTRNSYTVTNQSLIDSYNNCDKNYKELQNDLSKQSGGELKPTINNVGGKKKRRRSKKSKKGGKKSKRSGKSRRHRK